MRGNAYTIFKIAGRRIRTVKYNAKAADNLMNKQEAAATAIERTENAANGLARKSSRARSVLNAMANGVTGIADAAYRAENALNGMMGKLRKAPESSGGGFLSSTIGQFAVGNIIGDMVYAWRRSCYG